MIRKEYLETQEAVYKKERVVINIRYSRESKESRKGNWPSYFGFLFLFFYNGCPVWF